VEIRNNLNTLNSVANVEVTGNQPAAVQRDASATPTEHATDRATVSTAGVQISQPGSDADVRWEKVAAVQQALADGTYDVPASEVATKMVDSMLGDRS
jgi:negative regulator of flagellin synthesis FlgM